MTDVEVGSAAGSQKVILKLGPFVNEMNPTTARALAIQLIHLAEIAQLPAPEPKPPKSRLKLALP